MSWKLGRPCPTKISTKGTRLKLWLELKDDPSIGDQLPPWGEIEESELLVLTDKIENITIADTQLGRQNEEAKMAALTTLRGMSAGERAEFLAVANASGSTLSTVSAIDSSNSIVGV